MAKVKFNLMKHFYDGVKVYLVDDRQQVVSTCELHFENLENEEFTNVISVQDPAEPIGYLLFHFDKDTGEEISEHQEGDLVMMTDYVPQQTQDFRRYHDEKSRARAMKKLAGMYHIIGPVEYGEDVVLRMDRKQFWARFYYTTKMFD